MSMDRRRVITIIPAFNEEAKIGGVIRDIQKLDVVDEIVVIDDGSRDRTAEIVREHGATVISLIVNLGYGAALQTGYKYGYEKGYDVVVQMDGDGQHEAASLPHLIQTLDRDNCDVVIGSRFMDDSKSYQAPMLRRVGMRFFGFLIHLITKKEITDPTSGLQALDRKVIRFLAEGNVYPPDYPDADIIILLNNVGFKIVEIPVTMYENETGKSIHSGWRPVYYVVKMMLSIFSVLFGQYRTFLRK